MTVEQGVSRELGVRCARPPGLAEQAGVKAAIIDHAPDAGVVERLFWDAIAN